MTSVQTFFTVHTIWGEPLEFSCLESSFREAVLSPSLWRDSRFVGEKIDTVWCNSQCGGEEYLRQLICNWEITCERR